MELVVQLERVICVAAGIIRDRSDVCLVEGDLVFALTDEFIDVDRRFSELEFIEGQIFEAAALVEQAGSQHCIECQAVDHNPNPEQDFDVEFGVVADFLNGCIGKQWSQCAYNLGTSEACDASMLDRDIPGGACKARNRDTDTDVEKDTGACRLGVEGEQASGSATRDDIGQFGSGQHGQIAGAEGHGFAVACLLFGKKIHLAIRRCWRSDDGPRRGRYGLGECDRLDLPRRGEPINEGLADFELLEEPHYQRFVIPADDTIFEHEPHRCVGHNGGQITTEFSRLTLPIQYLVVAFGRGADIGKNGIDAPELVQQRDRTFFADPLDSGDVVRRVAFQTT